MPRRKFSRASQVVWDFDLQDVGSLAEMFARRFVPMKIEVAKAGEQVGARGACGALAGLEFDRMEFLGGLKLVPQRQVDAVFFCFPTAGTLTFHSGWESIRGSTTSTFAFESSECNALEVSAGHAHYALVVNRSLFIQRLSVLLGHPVVEKPVFMPMIDLPSDSVGPLKSLISFITASEFGPMFNHAKLTSDRLREMLVDMVLETWPNNYSKILRQPPPMIAPRHVKPAIDFIQDHPPTVPSGAELAALSGISLRALQTGFRRFAGLSITAYQRQFRLERAHEDLVRDTGTSIEDIALRWGFTNAGRFSRYFKAAYGVSPADLAGRHIERN